MYQPDKWSFLCTGSFLLQHPTSKCNVNVTFCEIYQYHYHQILLSFLLYLIHFLETKDHFYHVKYATDINDEVNCMHCALLSLQPLEVFHDSVIAAERSMEMDEVGSWCWRWRWPLLNNSKYAPNVPPICSGAVFINGAEDVSKLTGPWTKLMDILLEMFWEILLLNKSKHA